MRKIQAGMAFMALLLCFPVLSFSLDAPAGLPTAKAHADAIGGKPVYSLQEGEQLAYSDFYGESQLAYDVTNGKYLIAIKKGSSYFVVSTDGRFGPFDGVILFDSSDGGAAFWGQKTDKKWYATVNGKEYGPYASVNTVVVDSAGFGCCMQKSDAKYYALVYGKEFGPFAGSTSNLHLGKGSYGFSYYVTDDSMKVQINGKEHGPSFFMSISALSKNGYIYEVATGPYTVVINGKEYADFSSSCQSMKETLLESGAWFFTQAVGDSSPEQHGIHINDGTIVTDALTGGRLYSRGGGYYCGWFGKKGSDVFYDEKKLRVSP